MAVDRLRAWRFVFSHSLLVEQSPMLAPRVSVRGPHVPFPEHWVPEDPVNVDRFEALATGCTAYGFTGGCAVPDMSERWTFHRMLYDPVMLD